MEKGESQGGWVRQSILPIPSREYHRSFTLRRTGMFTPSTKIQEDIMNNCILTGNLGADPESLYTTEGTHIVNFPLAFRSGKDKTSWIRVTCFGKQADSAEAYLHKGARIGVSGHLDQDKWTGTDGEHKSTFKLIANQVEFIKTNKSNPHEEEFAHEEEVAL
jgi:single-strand DNA-binding protein